MRLALALLLLLALFGWAQGFVTGALALIGFALGAWLGTRLAGLVLPDGSRNPWAPAIGLVGALCLGAALARLEARVALTTLLDRFPAIEATGPASNWMAFTPLRTRERLELAVAP